MERHAGWTLRRAWLHEWIDFSISDPRRAFADNRRARLRAKRARRTLPKWMRREMARGE